MTYGLSREEEEKQLKEILQVAQENLDRTERGNKDLAAELTDMLDAYDVQDKEALALWNNTELRYQESKHDVLRAIKARKKPYFGRIDIVDPLVNKEEDFYVGRVGISRTGIQPLVIDWRAPLASVYYENSLGTCAYEVKNEGIHEIDLKRKRTYEISNDTLIDFFDSDVVANDELLTKYLAKSKKAVLSDIIGTIQKEQNRIIRKSPKTNLIVQGVAGSGKTTVAMHRISYILYNYEEFLPKDFYIIGSNRILLNYITSVLPDLDVYGISQMTMEQLFTRLMYEDFDVLQHKIGYIDRKDEAASIKGSYLWFHELQEFCDRYEMEVIPLDDFVIEQTGVVLLEKDRIERYIHQNTMLSTQNKIDELNLLLLNRLENELIAKAVTYGKEERKALKKECSIHFGKDEWRISIYGIYERFLKEQREKGRRIFVTGKTYDVYDLAALAFLYKRIKEKERIREASHIIIDEAQDFGMMAYGALAFCLRDCTYTIMGDVSQNIHYGYGLNDWEDLRKLILTGPYDTFGLLSKSYRNTVEISNFATEILHHGSFPVYPVEPILRHGDETAVIACSSEDALFDQTVDTITAWLSKGHETIAVVCKDAKEAAFVSERLKNRVPVSNSDLETAVFDQGVMVLPVDLTKGLEFDAVLIFRPTKENYPAEDQYVKLLYVAATRALHELCVLHTGDLSDLIATKVPEEKRMVFLKDDFSEEITPFTRVDYSITEEKKQYLLNKYLKRTKELNRAPKAVQTVLFPEDREKAASYKTEPIKMEQKTIESVREEESKEQFTDGKVNLSKFEFNGVPSAMSLTPAGHSRIDSSVKWVKKGRTCVEVSSSYGLLRISPLTDRIIRIQFRKGQSDDFTEGEFSFKPEQTIATTVKETSSVLEIKSEQMITRIDKRNGSLQFLDKNGVLLVKEEEKLPRQIDTAGREARTYSFFSWPKNEKLSAKGVRRDELVRMEGKARYISFGGRKLRMPLLVSGRGYGLAINASQTVLFCGIPMYGQYVFTDGTDQIDFYFIYGENTEETIKLYQQITSV